MTLSQSESQLLRHLADAVEAGNQDRFDDHIAMGRAYLDDDARLVQLLNEHLPQALDTEQIPVLLQMLAGEDYDLPASGRGRRRM